MTLKLYFFALLLLPLWVSAQLIDNSECQAFSETPFFNREFIQRNGIRQIRGKVSSKKTLQAIEDRKLVVGYVFDKKGRLIEQYRSFNNSDKKDTTFIYYYYDENDNIITQRMSDSYGFFSNNYTYNPLGQMTEKTYCRDENTGKDKQHFKLGKQHIIVKETFSYENTDSTLHQHTYNSRGKKYKTISSYFNKHGLLSKDEKKLMINKKKSKTLYQYDDKGNISEKTVYPDYKKDQHTTTKYLYDELGNLEYIDEYVNGKHITHKEILYDKSTYLMKALLVQDIETNFIKIIKYTYDYY